MSERIAPHGPFKISVEFFIKGEEGRGTIAYDLSPGKVPTPEDIQDAMKECESALSETSMRMMDRHEFCNVLIQERTGSSERFAIPDKNEWEPA